MQNINNVAKLQKEEQLALECKFPYQIVLWAPIFRAFNLSKGKATSQTQRITIGTPPERLPLGPKSSYWLYGELLVLRSRRFLDYLRSRRRSCIVSAALCGGPAADEHCSFNSNEFTTYETFLSELGDLDVGALRKECRCPTRDPSCEVLPNPTNGLDFGPRIIKSFGVCQVLEEQKPGVNLGMVKRQSVQCAEGWGSSTVIQILQLGIGLLMQYGFIRGVAFLFGKKSVSKIGRFRLRPVKGPEGVSRQIWART